MAQFQVRRSFAEEPGFLLVVASSVRILTTTPPDLDTPLECSKSARPSTTFPNQPRPISRRYLSFSLGTLSSLDLNHSLHGSCRIERSISCSSLRGADKGIDLGFRVFLFPDTIESTGKGSNWTLSEAASALEASNSSPSTDRSNELSCPILLPSLNSYNNNSNIVLYAFTTLLLVMLIK